MEMASSLAPERLADEAGRLAALQRYAILDTAEEAAFERITELVQLTLDVPIATVSLVAGDRQWFKSAKGVAARETPRAVAFCNHTIRQRRPLLVPDATADSRFSSSELVTGEPHIRSYLGIPLATPDHYNLGALCAIDTEPRTFDAREVALLERFAALVTREMELRQIASTDPLTGVATRRAFLHEADKLLARHARHGSEACLAVFDIDHFKQVNDTWGHPAGDAVLRTVTDRVGACLRENDVIGRLGGEEFGLLLAEADEPAALGCLERLRGTIAADPVATAAGTVKVTASFGVAGIEATSALVDRWLARADAVLYAAKAAGRNRCIAAGETQGEPPAGTAAAAPWASRAATPLIDAAQL